MVRTSKPKFVSLGGMSYLRILASLCVFLWLNVHHVSAQQVTVHAGDTLSSLAAEHETTVDALMRINNLGSQHLRIGDTLFVRAPYREIKVSWGDTLSTIAKEHRISIQDLIALNALADNKVEVGQVLRIPTADVQATQAVAVASVTTDNARADNVASSSAPEPVSSAIAVTASRLETEAGVYQVIIQPGDTLSTIAAQYHVNVKMLMKLNNLSSSRIRVGDVLFVSPSASPESLERITVARGDSLSTIAQRHNTTVSDLMLANNLDGIKIKAGQELLLPRDARKASDAPPEYYTVQENDALYNIALEYRLPVETLVAINNLEGSMIYPGQVLRLKPDKNRDILRVQVARGETLSHIAFRYNLSIKELSQANNISRWDTLSIGQRLVIPGHYEGEAKPSLQLATTSSRDRGGVAQEVITVVRGDSLSAIATRYNTNVAALLAENRLPNTRIKAGQRLRVTPGAGLLPPATTASANVSNATGLDNIIWPLHGTITSHYGYRNLSGLNNHTGIDIDGAMGDVIVAASAGRVTHSGVHGGYGKTVIIEQGKYKFIYAHASAILVSAGEYVNQGQAIARVGNTGTVTRYTPGGGTHLHFEIRVNNKPTNPWPYLEAAR